MTSLWLLDLTGRAAGRSRRSHRDVIHSKHFRAGPGVSRERSLRFCSSRSQCSYTVCSRGSGGACWWPGQGDGQGAPGRHPGHGSPAGKEAEEFWGQVLSRDRLCAASFVIDGTPVLTRGHSASPTLQGALSSTHKLRAFVIPSAPSPLRSGRSQLQLPPSQALLAPAAGPETPEHP